MINRQLLETESSISYVKECFTKHLSQKLNLTKVSSPIALLDGTGINDDLNGVEKPVTFRIKALGEMKAQVVHSLAKWKRIRLMQLGVEPGSGILTDMRALRPDEDYTDIHSVYVDQWDWEQTIRDGERNLNKLNESVSCVYEAMKCTEQEVCSRYPSYSPVLPERITFIHSQQLLDLYPDLSPKSREREAARRYGAIFITGIGMDLSDGKPHDGRAPDYDDWSSVNDDGYIGLNGDIIVWHPVLKCSLELSSMGIRVNMASLIRQLSIKECPEKASLQYHSMLLNGLLPQSIGGGIGQSRLCMFMLKKKHIGEVQVGIWSDEIRNKLGNSGIELL
ncbi:MAG: aspartate--ammonia ligase [Bacteroidales bacterium]|nr:aspartate--ammonia ligase [Bacteroidales bacterium]MDD2426007.1 aspartate--ammonia ligase [Bacteroidales bacterium]MDD3990182.1 aspartate--ammonia ligase [Bacteroidales bacterium]MDD4639445.1 aspartate--ammonia ligase [Bacteroidales bacterium]